MIVSTKSDDIRNTRDIRDTRRFNGSGQNRSLERGLEVLRAFRPGIDLLGNGELAERTGLARATVSRLTQTLVTSGFLTHDPFSRAYRLAVPVLSLGHAMRVSSPALRIAAPLMRDASVRLNVNVGLASPDCTEMVYLDSIRYHQKISLRSVVSGQRVPIALTSLGHAYLSMLATPGWQALFDTLRRGYRPDAWRLIAAQMRASLENLDRHGVCWASWQPNVVALAAPLGDARQTLALNFSLPLDNMPVQTAISPLMPKLLCLRESIMQGLRQQHDVDAIG